MNTHMFQRLGPLSANTVFSHLPWPAFTVFSRVLLKIKMNSKWEDARCKILGSGRSPGRANGTPLEYSYLKNSMGLVGYSPWSLKESDVTEHMHRAPETLSQNPLVFKDSTDPSLPLHLECGSASKSSLTWPKGKYQEIASGLSYHNLKWSWPWDHILLVASCV